MVRRLLSCVILLGFLSTLPTATTQAAGKSADEFVQMIIKLISDPDKEFRAAGLEQVRTAAKGDSATQLFAAQLNRLDASAQIALISALADRGDATARKAILDLLNSSKDESVRAAAIASIGKLGGPADLPFLIESLSATSSAEQAAALRSLVLLRGDTVSKNLAAELKSASPVTKSALIEVLATRRASDEFSAFIAATVDDSALVRKAGVAALGQLGHPEHIALMLPGILKAERGVERDNAERNVVLICLRIENEDLRGETVIRALNTIPDSERDELLPLVGRVGGKALINFVVGIATGEDLSRRRIGIDALSKWPDSSVADRLMEIVIASTNPAERHQAFQGFVKNSSIRDKQSDKQRLDRMKEAMKVAQTPDEQTLVINRTRTALDIGALRFILPYVDETDFAQIACETIVELAHNRDLRIPNKEEFDVALDKVIETSKDAVVVDRAQRYKHSETWERPRK